MSQRSALALIALVAVACEAREVTVFELAAGGVAGTAGTGGHGGNGGQSEVASGGGGASGGGSETAGSAADLGGSSGTTAGSGGGDQGLVCTSKDDCPQGWFCEKESCDAPTGLCNLRPIEPIATFDPVCGCDGITYWNDENRRAAGRTLLHTGQCSTTALPCADATDCGLDFASCARLVSRGEMCSPSSEGACWLSPERCPDPKDDPDTWQECRPPVAGLPPPPCVDTCWAIKSERVHQHPRDPEMCP